MAKEEERYDTEEALGKFLEQVDKDYTQYSEELFKQGVRKKSQIAHASVDLLERYGVLPIHGSDLKAKCQVPDKDIAQRDHWDEVHAVCTISGPNGQFDADVLLDSGSTMELKLSRYKADQLGLGDRGVSCISVSSHGTHKTVLKRGAANVDINMKGSSELAASARLEVWVEEDTNAPNASASNSAPSASKPRSKRQRIQSLTPKLRIHLPMVFSPVKDSTDKFQHSISLGWPAVKKLRLGVDPDTSTYVIRHKDHRG